MDLANAQIRPNMPNAEMAVHGSDASLHVEFSTEALYMEFKSKQEGRPIYEDRPFITIYYPGIANKVTKRFVEDGDAERFPKQWEAFQRQAEEAHVGLPIGEWSQLSKSQVAELKAMHVHTVEQLAGMPDSQLPMFGARDLIEKAKLWTSKAGEKAVESKLMAENQDLKDRLAALEAQFAQQKSADIKLKTPKE